MYQVPKFTEESKYEKSAHMRFTSKHIKSCKEIADILSQCDIQAKVTEHHISSEHGPAMGCDIHIYDASSSHKVIKDKLRCVLYDHYSNV